jgi:hypothetical protein
MKTIIYRKSKMFCIDKSKLSKKANNNEIINALYASIYDNFLGAAKNPSYKGLNPKEMLEKVNEYANKWLKSRGLL